MNSKKALTVFTPAYNRAYTLHLGYEALLRQTCKDFVWLIVDDPLTILANWWSIGYKKGK